MSNVSEKLIFLFGGSYPKLARCERKLLRSYSARGAIRGPSIARVVESKLYGFKPQDLIFGLHHWEDYFISDPDTVLLSRLNSSPEFPLPYYFGGLAGFGHTTYMELHETGLIKKGDIVLVSAAAGATGSMACQIAPLYGCKVVGTLGSDEKAALVKDRLKNR